MNRIVSFFKSVVKLDGTTEQTEYIAKVYYDDMKNMRDYWQTDSAAAWDKCEERRLENEKLRIKIKDLLLNLETLQATIEIQKLHIKLLKDGR